MSNLDAHPSAAPGPSRPSKRDEILKHTGQRLYLVIEFDDGTWYRE
jgi:hypothetical protein